MTGFPTPRHDHQGCGFQFLDALVESLGCGDVTKSQIQRESARVQILRKPREDQKRLDLRGKGENSGVLKIIERFFSCPIPRQQELFLPAVPEGQREHSVEVFDEGFAVLLVERQDYFRIGSRAIGVAGALRALFLKIINLAIEHNGHIRRRPRHRLAARVAQIDNSEPSVAEASPDAASLPGRIELHIAIVRPPVVKLIAHFLERGFELKLSMEIDYAADSTHTSVPYRPDGLPYKQNPQRDRRDAE